MTMQVDDLPGTQQIVLSNSRDSWKTFNTCCL
jgi:hypothetical protein